MCMGMQPHSVSSWIIYNKSQSDLRSFTINVYNVMYTIIMMYTLKFIELPKGVVCSGGRYNTKVLTWPIPIARYQELIQINL